MLAFFNGDVIITVYIIYSISESLSISKQGQIRLE